ncbi:MAG: RsiV family protein [Clostridiales bacterium]|nr:RsiV family protein [Clostridiales bacterium]
MIRDFTKIDRQGDSVEEVLGLLKEEYMKPKMSQEQLEKLRAKMKEADRAEKNERKNIKIIRLAATAAVIAGVFIILPNTSATVANAMENIPIIGQLVKVVTFRDYQYETDRNMANVKVPEIKVPETIAEGQTESAQAQESGKVQGNGQMQDSVQIQDNDVLEKLERTTEEINAEIQEITDKLIEEFEENMKNEQGYQDIYVNSEVLATTDEYFTLKLICYQGAGSGYEWNYFYTIDLTTGERLKLKDVFKEGADYITPISENIKEQMQAQMDADENVIYWLHDDIDEWNFKSITDETSFYLNEDGNLVIGFNEGDVAPMYMGTVEFAIPEEVVQDIRK